MQIDLRGCGESIVVRLRGSCRFSADHSDTTGSGGSDSSSGGRQDHLYDGHAIAFPGITKHRRATRIAGDDQDLDALPHQVIKALESVLTDVRDWLLAVRGTRGVTQVDDVFVGQLVDDRAGYRKPAEPRVEDADRRFSISRHERSAYKRSRPHLGIEVILAGIEVAAVGARG